MATEQQSLRSLIGGKWAVSWQGYLILLPISILFIMFTTPAFAPVSMWGEGLLISAVAYGATGGVLALSAVTVLRTRLSAPAPIATVAVVGGVAWAVRSVVLYAYLDLRSLSSLAGLEQRILYGFVLGAVLVPVSGWFVASAAVFRRERQELIDVLVGEELASDRLATYVEAMRQGIMDRVQQAVRHSAATMDWQQAGVTPSQGVAALDRVSDEAAKELSRSLWREAKGSARLNPAALVHSAASTRPFAYWVALPIVALALPVLLRIWPLESAVVILLVTAGWTLAVSVVANVVAPRMSPPKAVLAYASWIGLIALGSALAVQAVVDATGSYRPDGGNIPLLAALSYGVVYPLGGLVAGIGVARRQVLLGLRASISDEEVRRAALRHEEGEVRREIATTLHGSWSGNLTAVSMRLQQAIDDGDRQAAQEALHEARRIVDIDVAREIHRETADAHGVVHALVSSWEGLVVINADVDPDLDVSRGMLRAIEDVVTEGINNAVRHADAERVDVSIAACAGSVCVVIADDGAAPAAAPRRGMGSRLLDARAPSAWWREARAGGGSVLTVLLKPTDEVT